MSDSIGRQSAILDRAWQAFCDSEETADDYAVALAAALNAARPLIVADAVRDFLTRTALLDGLQTRRALSTWVHELDPRTGAQPTAQSRAFCPACGRSVALLRGDKLRWHYSDSPTVCVATGLTIGQYRPGMTQREADAIRYTKYRRK